MTTLQKAIDYAISAHHGDNRKGKDIPYITHPMSVALTLARAGAKEDVVIAGLLHDTIEDTETTYEDIKKGFGKSVADLVNAVTEQDKNLSWMERKMAALYHMDDMTQDEILLKSSDVLCNMHDLITDFKQKGDQMFASFNAGKDDQLTRYTKVVEKIEQKYPKNPLLPDLQKASSELKTLFTK